MADAKDYLAGSSSLVLGADSYTNPSELLDREYVMGQNVVCRGGIVQTRPGTRSLFCAPRGNFQGVTLFTPQNGVAHLVFAVDGKVYVSAEPFTSYRRLANLQFNPSSKYVAWASCLKSTDYDAEGVIYSLAQPYSVLMMQDGLTRAAYWDGSNSGHLNPAEPPFPDQSDIVPGFTETPVGLWMVWSGNRLWVSRGNQIFASDIGNPLKFTEATYLNEARAFYLSGPCTGFIETPDQQGIIAFTENDGTFFQSSIQERASWLSTPDFQKVILPNIGCVAPRSLLTQYGLNWWFASRGFTNLNAALRQNITSRIDYQDNEMFASKAYLSPDLSGICAGYYENYLMVSVPSGDVLNRHTWVLDQAPFEGNVNTWTGFWSGWRPVEWARGIVNGNERVFFGSVDYDGNNRLWEGMLEDRTDNGCPITCYAQLRDHAAGDLDQKRYEWSKFFLSQILGDVRLNVYVASTKGAYQLQKEYKIVATEGQVYADTAYSESGPLIAGNRVQTRTIRTPGDPEDNECNSCGVESKEGNMIDYAFSHLLVWSGRMGVRAYQMHMRSSPERDGGECTEDEVGPRVLNDQGCSTISGLYLSEAVFPTFVGTATGSMTLGDGSTVAIQKTVVSGVSQSDADARAQCAVDQMINFLTEYTNGINAVSIPAGVYGGNVDVTDVVTSGSGGPGFADGWARLDSPGDFIIVESPITPRAPGIASIEYASASGDAELCPDWHTIGTGAGSRDKGSPCAGPSDGAFDFTILAEFASHPSGTLDPKVRVGGTWNQTSGAWAGNLKMVSQPSGSVLADLAWTGATVERNVPSGDTSIEVYVGGNCFGSVTTEALVGTYTYCEQDTADFGALTPDSPAIPSSFAGTWSYSTWETASCRVAIATFNLANLTSGSDYRLTVDFAASSGPAPAQVVQDFTATGATESIQVTILWGASGVTTSIASSTLVKL